MLLLSLLTASMAAEPWMWGVGPTVGAQLAPVSAATTLDLPANRWGLRLGADAVLYPVEHHRVHAVAAATLGEAWVDGGLVVMWDWVPRLGRVELPLGVGLGVGGARLGAPGDDRVRLAYAPLRAEVAVLGERRDQAWQVTLYGEARLPTLTVAVDEVGERTPLAQRVGGAFGLELSWLWGDFAPPVIRPGWGEATARAGRAGP